MSGDRLGARPGHRGVVGHRRGAVPPAGRRGRRPGGGGPRRERLETLAAELGSAGRRGRGAGGRPGRPRPAARGSRPGWPTPAGPLDLRGQQRRVRHLRRLRLARRRRRGAGDRGQRDRPGAADPRRAVGPCWPGAGARCVNVSSVAGLQATPGNATYGATKAFVASFGEALAGEAGGHRRHASPRCCPASPAPSSRSGPASAGRKIPGPPGMSAEAVAAEALDAARDGQGRGSSPAGINKVAGGRLGAAAPRRSSAGLAAGSPSAATPPSGPTCRRQPSSSGEVDGGEPRPAWTAGAGR